MSHAFYPYPLIDYTSLILGYDCVYSISSLLLSYFFVVSYVNFRWPCDLTYKVIFIDNDLSVRKKAGIDAPNTVVE